MRKQQVEEGESRSCFVGMSCSEQSDFALVVGWAVLHCVKVVCLSQEDGVQAGGVVSCRLKGRVGVNCTSQGLSSLRRVP